MIKTIKKGLKVETKRQEYIHYGHKKFIDELFEPIQERELFVKPYGGLWASRSDSTMGWKNWCKNQEFHLSKYSDDNYFKFYLKQGTRILVIDNHKQLNDLPHIDVKSKFGFELSAFQILDFQKIAEEYDAMEVFHDNYTEIHYSSIFNSWDCDSICIWNLSKIKPIK